MFESWFSDSGERCEVDLFFHTQNSTSERAQKLRAVECGMDMIDGKNVASSTRQWRNLLRSLRCQQVINLWMNEFIKYDEQMLPLFDALLPFQSFYCPVSSNVLDPNSNCKPHVKGHTARQSSSKHPPALPVRLRWINIVLPFRHVDGVDLLLSDLSLGSCSVGVSWLRL